MRSLMRRPATDVPRDPAPSRWVYRYQRLMLTPGFRATVKVGVPILLVAAIATSWFSHEENRQMLNDQIAQAKATFQERPQFMVNQMNITGIEDAVKVDVASVLPVEFPVSSFALDLQEMRKTVEALDTVRSASVRVGQSGTLDVRVSPRVPVALWRDKGTLRLIDADGVFSGTVSARADRLDLPLIAGEGAEQSIDEALALFVGAGPLQSRVRGLVRMGERRWDIVLDRKQRILLPADNPTAALDRVIALTGAQDMLERDVAVVDMRNAARPTLRMSEEATAALRRVNNKKNTGADE